MRYRRKSYADIDAVQFTDLDAPPRGVTAHTAKTTGETYFVVETIQGKRVRVHPGEWIVSEGDGVHHYPISPDKFAELYEPAETNS